ncbi:MAG: sigma-54 dependent transcriptional regulator [Gammaproteobacteria bacterium]|jgi:DNA-binding NtrC family response regulator|nr:sigma-54 dependent transcriptional regulator [Gammaproteobacteria bacterium]
MSDTLLIIEDERLLGIELTRHFSKAGWDVDLAGSIVEARRLLFDEGREPLVVLADMSLPDGNSLDLLEQVRSAGNLCEWVLLTAYGSVPDSVRALQLGALDFLEKPCSTERLAAVLNGARRGARAQRRLRLQSEFGGRQYRPEAFLGHSETTRRLREMIKRLAVVPFSGLVISGETGTGKGLVARILHHSGPRPDGPMIEVNCAALPRDLLESELFGHEAGAFTGAKGRHRGYLEQADGGTLFLDEIGEMDLALQAKLLTAIEDRELRRVGGEKSIKVDVKVLVASNHDLEDEVRAGSFRADLYHRLCVFLLRLPALRERLDDLDELVPNMVAEFNAIAGRRVKRIPDSIYRRMRAYHWPGNVRELRNVIERCVLLASSEVFPERWLQLAEGLQGPRRGPEVEGDRVTIPLDGSMALDEMDSYIIQTALKRNDYNVTATARALGTTRETLRYRIQKYHLSLRAHNGARTEGERIEAV